MAWHTEDMDALAQGLPARPEPGIADVLTEFGETHQIEFAEFCVVAVRRPTPSQQEVTTGRNLTELLAKLRAERDGT